MKFDDKKLTQQPYTSQTLMSDRIPVVFHTGS